MTPIRILIADDHEVVREGLRGIIANAPEIEIIAEAASGEEAIKLAKIHEPDVCVLDLMMPGMDGIEAASKMPGMRILILSNFVDATRVREALRAGIKGYLLKDVLKDELIRAIQHVAEGKPYLHQEVQRHLMAEVAAPQKSPLEELTHREVEVLRQISLGRSNKEIGAKLSLTEGTVKGYVSAILLKLGVADRTQAALLAVKEGI